MTDKEYDKFCELGRPLTGSEAVQIEHEQRGIQCFPKSYKFPPLFLIPDHRLSEAAMATLRDSLLTVLERGTVIIHDPSITVYQLVNGRWELMPFSTT